MMGLHQAGRDLAMRILSLGAGIQSTTVALMSAAGELPPVDAAIFADTNWEPAAVYEHLDRLEPELPFPVHRVSAGNIREDATTPGRSASLPFFVRNEDGDMGIARRQCTNEYKLTPVYEKVRELCDVAPRARPKEVLAVIVMGISWDEAQRMRDPHFKWVRNEYPLVDKRLTRHDCNLWLERNWPHPVSRSACIGCPYRAAREWRSLPPEEFADAVAFEKEVQSVDVKFRGHLYLHRSGVPLDEVDFSTEEDRGQISLFDDECAGMCGV